MGSKIIYLPESNSMDKDSLPVPDLPDPKPGYQTTELGTLAGASVVMYGFAYESDNEYVQVSSLALITLMAMWYAWLRTKLKAR